VALRLSKREQLDTQCPEKKGAKQHPRSLLWVRNTKQAGEGQKAGSGCAAMGAGAVAVGRAPRPRRCCAGAGDKGGCGPQGLQERGSALPPFLPSGCYRQARRLRRTPAHALLVAACTYSLVLLAGVEGEGLVSVKPSVTQRCLSYYSFVFASKQRSRLTLPTLRHSVACPAQGLAQVRGNSGTRGSCWTPGLEIPQPCRGALGTSAHGKDDTVEESYKARVKILQWCSAEHGRNT